MSIAQLLFQQSTQQYRKGNYSSSIAMLNDCIILQPTIPYLYSNRALSNFGQKALERTIDDLQKSIKINHLHYVGYINLFSLYFLKNDENNAHRYLCLGLSSCYTSLHMFNKQQKWIDLSLHYGYNNKESLLLKAMYLYRQDKEQQSLLYINRTMQYQDNLEIIDRLAVMKSNIYQKIMTNRSKNNGQSQIQHQDQTIPLTFPPIQTLSKKPQYILQTSIPYNKQTYRTDIQNMMSQFNNINNLLNSIKFQILNKSSILQSKNQTDQPTEESKSKKDDSQIIIQRQINGQSKDIFSNYHSQEDGRKDDMLQQERSFKEQGKYHDSYATNINRLKIDSRMCYSNEIYLNDNKTQEQDGDQEDELSFEIVDKDILQKLQSYKIYKHEGSNIKTNIFIQKVSLYALQQDSKQPPNRQYYIILTYKSNNGNFYQYKTKQNLNKNHICRWQEWFEEVQLNDQPTVLTCDLYEKIGQEGRLIGGGRFVLQQFGFVNLAIFQENVHVGDLQLDIVEI